MTDKSELHDRIWLEAPPGADEEYGQQWHHRNVWGEDAIEYVRADLAIAPQAPVSAVPAAQMHDTGDGFGNCPIWYGDRPPIGTLLYASPPPPAQADDNALIRELVAALGEFLEFGEYAYSHGREAITKAKAAGYEP